MENDGACLEDMTHRPAALCYSNPHSLCTRRIRTPDLGFPRHGGDDLDFVRTIACRLQEPDPLEVRSCLSSGGEIVCLAVSLSRGLTRRLKMALPSPRRHTSAEVAILLGFLILAACRTGRRRLKRKRSRGRMISYLMIPRRRAQVT